MAEDISLDVEHFDWTGDGRLELSGYWSGVRGMRFVRPTLHVETGTDSHRLLAVLDHKPWSPEAGEWTAVFPWDGDPVEVESAALVVAPAVTIPLAAPGRKARGVVRAEAPKAPPAAAWEPEPRPDPEPEPETDPELELLEAERDAAVASVERVTIERDEARRDRDAANHARDTALAQERQALEEARRERDEARAELDKAISELRELRAKQATSPRDREALAEALRARDTAILARDEAVRARDFAEQQLSKLQAERQPPPAVVLPPPARTTERRFRRRQEAIEATVGPQGVHWATRLAALAALVAAIVLVVSFVF